VQGFVGCFVDGNASNPMFSTVISSNVASVQACLDAAAAQNVSYVAIQDGIVCKGSSEVPNNATRAANGWLDAPPGACSYPCATSTAGYPGPYPACGNAGKSAVYDVLVAKGTARVATAVSLITAKGQCPIYEDQTKFLLTDCRLSKPVCLLVIPQH
jgi:hypothetical protein